MKFDPEKGRGARRPLPRSRLSKLEVVHGAMRSNTTELPRGKDKRKGVKEKDGPVADFTKRGLLAGLLGLGALKALEKGLDAAAVAIDEHREGELDERVSEEDVEVQEAPVGRFPIRLQFSRLGENENRAGDIYALYLGLPEVRGGSPIPAEITIDGFAVLEKSYDKKDAHIRRNFDGQEREQYLRNSEQARNHARAVLAERSRSAKRFDSIQEFADDIKDIPSDLYNAFNQGGWDTLATRMSLDAGEKRLLKLIASKMDVRMLLAYSMTELFPSQTGLSLKIFEQYIQEGGIHVLELMPAMYDRYISHGLGQFTSLALQELEGDVRGASVVNRCLPRDSVERISGSVLHVDGYKEQFRAMWMFGVYNMARLVRQLSAEEMRTLEANSDDPEFGVELTQFLASQHHAPADDAFEEYIEHDMIGSHKRHARPRIRPYIQEAHDYYRALGSYLRQS